MTRRYLRRSLRLLPRQYANEELVGGICNVSGRSRLSDPRFNLSARRDTEYDAQLTNANSLNSLLSYARASLSSQLTSEGSSSSRINLNPQFRTAYSLQQRSRSEEGHTDDSPSRRPTLSDQSELQALSLSWTSNARRTLVLADRRSIHPHLV